MTDRISISERQAVFKSTCELLRILSRNVARQEDPLNITPQLLKRFVAAAMTCPGFTPVMKDDIGYMANLSDSELRNYGLPRFANTWRHQYAIAPKLNAPDDVVEVSQD
jgi:hypothetical protein